MDVPASIRRSLPLGMIGKVFILFFSRLKINGKNASNGKSESSLRLCVLRPYLLSYLTLTEISYYPGISLGLEKQRSKQTEKTSPPWSWSKII